MNKTLLYNKIDHSYRERFMNFRAFAIWKDVVGYEGLYKVSSMGEIKTLAKVIKQPNSGVRLQMEKIMSPNTNKQGYKYLNLCKDSKHKSRTVHRIAIEAFLPNPENKRCINHKNGVKADNCIDNLEWMTHGENNKHAYDSGLKESFLKGLYGKRHFSTLGVLQYSASGEFIKEFETQRDAAKEIGIVPSGISASVTGRQKLAGGYIWRLANVKK